MLADLLGISYHDEPRLSPETLIARLDRILIAAERAIGQIPDAQLDTKPPEGNRTVRHLAHHLFRLVAAFVDSIRENAFPEDWLLEEAPPQMHTTAQLVAYGAEVRRQLAEWVDTAPADAYERTVMTYYGEQSGHALLERTTWHAAQHLRQLYALMERMGIRPEHLLDPADLEGLPLPRSIW